MVVDDRGGPGFERLERPEPRRPADHLQVEGGVEPPPDLLEDLAEGRRDLRGRRHAPGERRVQVVMGADEPRRDRGHHALRPGPAAGAAPPPLATATGAVTPSPATTTAATPAFAGRGRRSTRGSAARAAAESRIGSAV